MNVPRHRHVVGLLVSYGFSVSVIVLMQATLRLVPDETDSSVLKVAFTLDASVPCKISIFFAAKEMSQEGCRIETAPK